MAPESPSYPKIIAEISGNHLGDLEKAKDLVFAAAEAGADFVKFQHYRPETITVRGSHPDLTISGSSPWRGMHLWDLYELAMTPWEWTQELSQAAHEVGVGWLSSPFDESAVDFLEGFNPAYYKIASFEIIDLPLIRRAAKTGRPLVISTGMATEEEISAAVECARLCGSTDLTLLRTNSGYPARLSEMNLNSISLLQRKWGCRVGLSDHTLGSTSAVVAVALGATMFEKHLTMLRSEGGPDSGFSVEPAELARYVTRIHEAFTCLGVEKFGPTDGERASLALRPSLRATRDVSAGEQFTAENIASVRPAGGLPPSEIDTVIGSFASRDLKQGDPVTSEACR